jgi:hypothetical protein
MPVTKLLTFEARNNAAEVTSSWSPHPAELGIRSCLSLHLTMRFFGSARTSDTFQGIELKYPANVAYVELGRFPF